MNYWIKYLSIIAVFFTVNAQASLIDRGNGMIYDTVLDITLLADANYAMTSGYDADGLLDWNAATSWTSNLSYNGITGWRMMSLNTDNDGTVAECTTEILCRKNEFSYLMTYSVLDFSGFSEFYNLSTAYWTSTFDPVNSSVSYFDFYWAFTLSTNVVSFPDYIELNVWAVHDGDIAAVPIPAAIWLMGSGLLLLTGFIKRNSRC